MGGRIQSAREWLTKKTKNNISKASLWRSVVAEFIATSFLVFIIIATIAHAPSKSTIEISFAAGFGVAVLVHIFGSISGAHLNPAVTAAAIITGDIRLLQAFLYTVAQLSGGIVGAVVAYALNTPSKRHELGCVKLAPTCNRVQGVFMEMILTGILELTILSTIKLEKSDNGYPTSIPIGLSVGVAHFIGIPYTGSSINPARAFGPAVVTNTWPTYHWIYWIGPYIGAIFTALFYTFVLTGSKRSQTVMINMDENGSCRNIFRRPDTVDSGAEAIMEEKNPTMLTSYGVERTPVQEF